MLHWIKIINQNYINYSIISKQLRIHQIDKNKYLWPKLEISVWLCLIFIVITNYKYIEIYLFSNLKGRLDP